MQLYKVTLNFSGELHTFYTHAAKKSLALNNAVRQLTKKLKINYSFYRAMYNGQKDNFKTEEVKPCSN